MQTSLDLQFLFHALELAKIRRGFCAPNPSVGAIVVNQQGIVIAEGYHAGCGLAHAEVDALNKLNGHAKGATVYVTLEPCCHWGKTPPCTDALIQAGVSRVVYAFQDPNPVVSGKSRAILLAAGITCDYIPLPEITAFYASYYYWHRTKKPFITAKIAMSLNGKIAKETGEPVQLTGAALREFTHQSRKNSDAILTTAKTIHYDDPQMNVRYQDEVIAKPLYILDSKLTLSLNAKIFSTVKSITLFHAKGAAAGRLQNLVNKGVRCIAVDTAKKGLDLEQIITHMGNDGVHDLWIEAGGVCFSAFFEMGLLQKAFIYVAPVWLSEGKEAFSEGFSLDAGAYELAWRQYGDDALCEMNKRAMTLSGGL